MSWPEVEFERVPVEDGLQGAHVGDNAATQDRQTVAPTAHCTTHNIHSQLHAKLLKN